MYYNYRFRLNSTCMKSTLIQSTRLYLGRTDLSGLSSYNDFMFKIKSCFGLKLVLILFPVLNKTHTSAPNTEECIKME